MNKITKIIIPSNEVAKAVEEYVYKEYGIVGIFPKGIEETTHDYAELTITIEEEYDPITK